MVEGDISLTNDLFVEHEQHDAHGVSSLPIAVQRFIEVKQATVFFDLFPRVMISSLSPLWNLTIYNAASGPYSLTVMSIIALTLLPVIIIYQGWTYCVFRHRLQPGGHLDY